MLIKWNAVHSSLRYVEWMRMCACVCAWLDDSVGGSYILHLDRSPYDETFWIVIVIAFRSFDAIFHQTVSLTCSGDSLQFHVAFSSFYCLNAGHWSPWIRTNIIWFGLGHSFALPCLALACFAYLFWKKTPGIRSTNCSMHRTNLDSAGLNRSVQRWIILE